MGNRMVFEISVLSRALRIKAKSRVVVTMKLQPHSLARLSLLVCVPCCLHTEAGQPTQFE